LNRVTRRLLAWCAILAAVRCTPGPAPAAAPLPEGVEAVSLLGDTLRAPPLAPATRETYERRLAEAQRDLAARPDDPDALIWVGRRTAYLGRYRDAIAIFTRGVERFPGDARFLRHRGHRYISVREFAAAERDLARAVRLVRDRPDEVEPDGLPNARNVPTSTLQGNIWYHLGLARYLRGDFAGSREAWDAGLTRSVTADMRVATTYWRYLTLLRLGRDVEAAAALEPITRDLDIIENTGYWRLLLMFKGQLEADSLRPAGAATVEDATTGYGLGAWHLLNGRRDQATATFRRILAGGQWAAFGYIAAEAELERLAR
jgi:tetratricopeptide (TPR) repeat protein